jgi:hypothetical protein
MFCMTFHDDVDLGRLPPDAELMKALRVLSAATPDVDYTAIEKRLQRAFAQRQRPRARGRRASQWAPMAAALLLLCGGVGAWWSGHAPATLSTLESRSFAANGLTVPLAPAIGRSSIREAVIGAAHAKPARVAAGDAVEHALSLLADFVPLPGAAALPALERADVVRIEVPVAGLAAYGFDMVPDATPVAVAADLLIGQDGVARAIRLTPERVR